jgi:hypothetical protein
MLNQNNAVLVQILNQMINKYGTNRQVKEYLKSKFIDKNLLSSYPIKILTKRLELETLDIKNDKELFVLFVFTEGLQEALQLKDRNDEHIGLEDDIAKLDVKDYFTVSEQQYFSKHSYATDKEEGYPYIFSNMLKVADGHYTGIISAQELALIDKANDIIYNFNTQRNAKIDVFGIKRINVNNKKIQEITENLLSGKQFADEIKINILRNGDDEIEFATSNGVIGDLTVVSGEMNIFDGFHRKTANQLAIIKNPELQFNWKLTLTNFTEQKAQDFMVQINKQTPIKKEYINTLDKNKIENLVVDLIIDNPLFELSDKIKNTEQELRYGGYTKKSLLATAIIDNYNDLLTSKSMAKPIADWIMNFINHISQFLNSNNFSTNKYMFMAYVALSRKLYGVDNWVDIVSKEISSYDFTKNNENNIYISNLSGNLNKTAKNKLYNLFNGVRENE